MLLMLMCAKSMSFNVSDQAAHVTGPVLLPRVLLLWQPLRVGPASWPCHRSCAATWSSSLFGPIAVLLQCQNIAHASSPRQAPYWYQVRASAPSHPTEYTYTAHWFEYFGSASATQQSAEQEPDHACSHSLLGTLPALTWTVAKFFLNFSFLAFLASFCSRLQDNPLCINTCNPATAAATAAAAAIMPPIHLTPPTGGYIKPFQREGLKS